MLSGKHLTLTTTTANTIKLMETKLGTCHAVAGTCTQAVLGFDHITGDASTNFFVVTRTAVDGSNYAIYPLLDATIQLGFKGHRAPKTG
jgi:hypothetical protein